MRRFSALAINEARLQLFEMRQYWFEAVMQIAVMTALFLGLFFGMKAFLLESDATANLDGLLFGYILFNFMFRTYSTAFSHITLDTQTGVLEQLFLCPDGFIKLMTARVLSGLLFTFTIVLLLAFLAMSLTGHWLEINYLGLLISLALGAPALIGLGFAVGGLVLVFKRINTLAQVLGVATLGLVMIDGLPFGFGSFLPFTPAASLARLLALEGEMPLMIDIAVVFANSGAYLLLGILLFRKSERYAKRRNLIGIY